MATLHKPQITKQTRTVTISWRPGDDTKVHDLAAEEARIIERFRNHDPLDYLAPLRSRI